MPLLDQLKQFSSPGNPDGVCAFVSATTAHVLVHGPDSLSGTSPVKLPLMTFDEPHEISAEDMREGNGPAAELDVSKLDTGVSKIWKWKGELDNKLEGGKAMIDWLKGSDAPAGVYVGCVDDDDDEHFFNIAKTDRGQVYLVDSSMQNFAKLKGSEDLDLPVINIDNDGQVPFSKIYCSRKMKLDFCGPLHEECAQELQKNLKRSVREDYSPSTKPSISTEKHSIRQ